MWKLLVIIFVFRASYVNGQTADYCESKLCSVSEGRHIACQNSGLFGPECRSDRTMIDIIPFKNYIVKMHNDYRNRIAGGEVPGFRKAARMATMQWDDELAKIAVLNVKQCVMRHDTCRNTARFKHSGQNLAWRWGIPAPTTEQVVTTAIDNWFNEYKYAACCPEYVDKFPRTDIFKRIGHFTVMVVDRNTRVGCGMLRQSKDGGIEYFFACNYAQSNIVDRPIYAVGDVASKCIAGKNSQFPALCNSSEPIDPNQILEVGINVNFKNDNSASVTMRPFPEVDYAGTFDPNQILEVGTDVNFEAIDDNSASVAKSDLFMIIALLLYRNLF